MKSDNGIARRKFPIGVQSFGLSPRVEAAENC